MAIINHILTSTINRKLQAVALMKASQARKVAFPALHLSNKHRYS
jgi:Na+-transporting methylmalonyl-CoA/oxaloacetate decarboxylase beta subunit